VKLSRVKETLLDGKEAHKIFKRSGKLEFLVRLNMARAVVYGSLGKLHRALRLLVSTLETAKGLGTSGQYLGTLYMNIGLAYEGLGDFAQALTYYEHAQYIFNARNETRNIALIEINIAYIAQAQSHYRQSLQLLHGILERGVDQFAMEYLAIKRDMTECYLQLNRYFEARDLAHEVVSGYRTRSTAYEIARSLLHLATAEAELGNFTAADTALKEADHIFEALEATSWQAIVRLRRGRIALRQSNIKGAYQEAIAAATDFELKGQQVNYAAALLLQGQALFAHENFDLATEVGYKTLAIAQHYNVPSLRYSSHLLLGKIAEVQNQTTRAMRRYQAAMSAVERVQHALTITLRPGFLEDKGEASQALMAMYLSANQAEKAFETVERSKSQIWLSYLLNREHLRWMQDSHQTRTLISELNQLRAEHQWFYRLAHEPPRRNEQPNLVLAEQALIEVTTREKRMRTITEQLYLYNDPDQQLHQVPKTALPDIQRALKEGTLLIEYYSNGSHVWAFVLYQGGFTQLSTTNPGIPWPDQFSTTDSKKVIFSIDRTFATYTKQSATIGDCALWLFALSPFPFTL
jgi:tetratricopeptide (TPR) repeat protein